MNLALLGYGSIARSHMKALANAGVRLRTVMGRLAEPTAAFAAEYGFERHTIDLDDALDDPAVDVVLITSPTDLHAAQAAKALQAGKHALVEIPLATSLVEVDSLASLAREQKRCLMVCHTQRFQPAIVEARRWIAEGRLHVHHVLARFGFLRRENVNWAGRRRSWTDNLLWHHGCHAVDTSLWLLGAAETTVTSQVALPSQHLNIPLDLDILMRTPRDQLISVNMSYNTMIKFNDYMLIGEETTLLATLQRLESPEGVLLDRTGDTDADAIRAQDCEFLAAVREGREPLVSAASIRPTMAALQATQDQFDAWAPKGSMHPV